jgi:hypothetical protein
MPTSVDPCAPPTGPRGSVYLRPALGFACVTILGSHSVSGGESYDVRITGSGREAVSKAASPTRLTAFTEEHATSNRLRNLRLAALIRGWMEEVDSDDEIVGPLLDQVLRESPLDFGG